MTSLQWSMEPGEYGNEHIAAFEDKDEVKRQMVVIPAELDGKVWYSLEESDPDILGAGDQDVFFSSPDAAKDYAQKLVDVHRGFLPASVAGINYSPTGEQEWSPLAQA